MYYYDLYIPIGGACRPAFNLIMNDLRSESYPLDWQFGYSLDTVLHLFKTKFEDFFVDIKEDNAEWDGEHRWIKDIKNNIISIHHFSREIEIENAQKDFLQKMHKRFEKLNVKLEKARRIVLICNRTDTIEKFEIFLKEFSKIYPHLEIKLINMRNNEKMKQNLYESKLYVVSDSLFIEEYILNDSFNSFAQEEADCRGNVELWGDILNNYFNDYKLQIMQKKKTELDIVVIYGAGKRCLDLLYKFGKSNIHIKGIAVTDIAKNPRSIRSYGVDVIEKYNKEDKIIISLEDRKEAVAIKNVLWEKGYHNLYYINNSYILEKACL